MSIHIISDEFVRQSISAEECIQAVEEGFRLFFQGKILQTSSHVPLDRERTSLNMYAAKVTDAGLGVKVLTAYEQNQEFGEPYIHAAILLLDANTGKLVALLEGRYLTGLRTAAAVAIGAKYLCRKNSRVLAILGSGLQARTHLHCHLAVHTFEKVILWARDPQKTQLYVKEMQPRVPIPIEIVDSANTACEQADVIACTTRSYQPLFAPRAVRPGTHIGVAGPFRSEGTEIPVELLHSGLLFVDDLVKFNSLWQPGTEPAVVCELATLIGQQKSGRSNDQVVTVFKPVGMAFEDILSAQIVMEKALKDPSVTIASW